MPFPLGKDCMIRGDDQVIVLKLFDGLRSIVPVEHGPLKGMRVDVTAEHQQLPSSKNDRHAPSEFARPNVDD